MSDLDNYYKIYYSCNKDKINAARRRKYRLKTQKLREFRIIDPTRAVSRTREYRMLQSAKQNSIKLNIPFNLELSDIQIPEFCPILGVRLNKGLKTTKDRKHSPSLDRVVPEKGYIKGNVCVISFQANRMKQDLTLPVLLRLIGYIEQNYDKHKVSKSLTEFRENLHKASKEPEITEADLPELDLTPDESLYESDLFNDWKDSVLEGLKVSQE